MRLDKYLKLSRLIKRRTLAKSACDAGRVYVNKRTAKAGFDVKEGDLITIKYGHGEMTIRVINLINNPRKDEATEMYTIESQIRSTNSEDE